MNPNPYDLVGIAITSLEQGAAILNQVIEQHWDKLEFDNNHGQKWFRRDNMIAAKSSIEDIIQSLKKDRDSHSVDIMVHIDLVNKKEGMIYFLERVPRNMKAPVMEPGEGGDFKSFSVRCHTDDPVVAEEQAQQTLQKFLRTYQITLSVIKR